LLLLLVQTNTTGEHNVAVGRTAMVANTTGDFNVAVGNYSLDANTDGDHNVAVGYCSLGANTEGDTNTAFGFQSMECNTTGCKNTGIGTYALSSNTTADDNVAIGQSSMTSSTTGASNTAVGRLSLLSNTTGVANIALGYAAGGVYTTSACNISIGYRTSGSAATGRDNEIIIGAGDGSNSFPGGGTDTIRMGKRTHYISNGFTSNANWAHSSDRRYKKNITKNKIGLDFINDLNTVTYKWKAQSELDPSLSEYDANKTQADSTRTQHGLIAQEVKESMDKLGVSSDFAGWGMDKDHKNKKQNISESMFVIPLIKAIQELTDQNKEMKAEIDELKKK